MNIEQIRADFEAWAAQHGHDLDAVMLLSKPPKFSHYVDQATQAAFESYQAGRASLQSPEYTAAIGEAGQAYLDKFKNAHSLPAEFRWSELWTAMCAAANKGRTGAPQSRDREDAERYRWLRDSALLFSQIEQPGVSGWMVGRRDHVKTRFYTYNGKELDAAIDHARRAEGGGK